MSQPNEAIKLTKDAKIKTNGGALASLALVFFFWGFIAASNSIFIPFCKSHFHLSQFESQLIGSSFYGAYFIGSLLLYLISSMVGYDILNKIGYKKGIILGLLISVVGALGIIPSANANSFPAILVSFFIVALGFSLQQTAAQPFAIALGDPATGSHRLNLTGGVNSFGTTLGPIIVSFFLFGSVNAAKDKVTVTNINNLYLIVASVFLAVAIFFTLSKKLPDGKNDAKFETSSKASKSLIILTALIIAIIIVGQLTNIQKVPLLIATLIVVFFTLFYSNNRAIRNNDGWGAMKYPQLVYGMIGIFVYVGTEVTIDNNFGALLKTPGYLTQMGLDEDKISKFVSLYWGSLMIGRWTGAIGVFKLSDVGKKIAMILVPLIAFWIVMFVNLLYGNNIMELLPYANFIIVAIAAFFYGQEKPAKTLLTLSILGAISMLIAVSLTGIISVYAIIFGGLCCSIMWPCIFSLGVAGLGKYTSQGSAFLIMMILGGAVIPPFQGALGDAFGMHPSYIVAACCFAILAFLAIKLKSVLKAQGLDFDAQVASGH
ncbi:MFS transporter [Hydrotalea sandarakina]|jgi:FHS family L-fucose permease-like MFS transporter|uniref:FHS family L-fucose permease-like MFS transporter n=1 Tax=Hydrotalea sandarakina TaxID=1004304 RepID=A0A2W7TSG3_9BACT|nr:MFS transporter [Hydrotalea sandarakina]PZX66052.1 FHS family L-fucose permease-like MFS transporter [Hydrotalea sandarakina]